MTIRYGATNVPAGTDAEMPPWPQWALDRHGARMLRPSESARVSRRGDGDSLIHDDPPNSTVYRANTLLIPEDILRNDDVYDGIRDTLRAVDIEMQKPERLPERGGGDVETTAEALDERPARDVLPRPVLLSPRPWAERSRENQAIPVVDAWAALQRLREADVAGADRISLEHLMVGAELGGVPTYSPNGGGASVGNGYGGFSTFSPYGRMPVAVCPEPPEPVVAQAGCRRPVVAVLDTGIGPHPWFGTKGGPEVAIEDTGFFHVYEVEEQYAKARGEWATTKVLQSVWDEPDASDALGNDTNPASGHGTFIAGIIRQHAPGADVLMMRVLHADNVAHEGDVLLGLTLLLEEYDLGLQIDVVSLSLGYYSESDRANRYSGELAAVIRRLTDRGIVVVAAAGNDSTTRPFFPAALAGQKPACGQLGVLSVGALNPNDSMAWFSNQGDFIEWWATGACVISSYPTDIRGSSGVTRTVPLGDSIRETVDPDDFSGGFAMWSGTSFAAPHVAAAVAARLCPPDTWECREDKVRRAIEAVNEVAGQEVFRVGEQET